MDDGCGCAFPIAVLVVGLMIMCLLPSLPPVALFLLLLAAGFVAWALLGN